MAIEVYWGSGSPYSWRVLLALEHKRLAYDSHPLQFSKQEHKSPQMLRMNPRGRVPVLKDGDYVVFESLACLLYLDRKYPEYPLFGTSAEEAGTIMRVICEYQAYAEQHVTQIVSAVFLDQLDQQAEAVTRAMHIVGGEARTIEGRLGNSDWLVGEQPSAADLTVFPGIMLLRRAMEKRESGDLRSRFLPMEATYPAIARWIQRVEQLPGYERTYPPHWRDTVHRS
ncbi:MAG: glutathione S-transferase family protein [Gammaproteobacteria bacterium]|nr:glutathione S-transferase family protein [Gammaproteobacteria bacterium]MDH5271597.1 glutathione S-transferase family protein [Gammaproteobacteria bacterium]